MVRPGAGVESRYLLSGLAACGSCSHNMTVIGGIPSKAHRSAIRYYGCSRYQTKGLSVCGNGLRARVERADAIVLGAIERTLLTPEAIDHVVDLAAANIERQHAEPPSDLERARMKRELRAMLGQFDELLHGEPPLARQVLRKFLDGPICFDATAENYIVSGRTKIGALFSNGFISRFEKPVVPRKGLEPPQCCHR